MGVCLGHQALAEAFGGNVVHADEIVHGKATNVFHTRKGIFKGLSLPFKAGRYHSLVVERESMPKEFVIEAETEDGMIMGVKHAEFACYGLQFHPESILTPEGEKIAKQFLEICNVT